jgi:hypothetical protein
MTKTFAVNSNNDLFVGFDGNISIASDLEAVKFACESATKAQLGEMIFDVDSGMPNFQLIWNGKPNVLQYEAALRNTILNVDGVKDVISIEITINNNQLNYTATILTIYGSTVLNG